MTISIRQSLFRILFVGVSITATLILTNVWSVTSKTAMRQLNQNLDIAANVLVEVLSERREQLYNSANVLTGDFGFKQAVASGDIPTIQSALQNHGQRIGADFMVLTDLSGEVMVSQPDYFSPGADFPYPSLINQVATGGGAEDAIIVDGSLYQVIMLTVNAPTPIAIAGVGFLDGDEFLAQIKSIIRADVIVSTKKPVMGKRVVLHSSMDYKQAQEVIDSAQESLDWLSVTFFNSNNYLTRTLALPDSLSEQVDIYIAVDVTEQFESFTSLQVSILSISLLAFLGSLVVSMLLSRKVSKPVSELVNAANRLADGNYQDEIKNDGKLEEINALSDAFIRMRKSIQHREQHITLQSQVDMLTGLYNRSYMEVVIQELLSQGQKLQVIGVNIQGFRTINDLYGYSNGDACVIRIAQRLRRWNGTAARLSGGELVWFANEPLTFEQLETFHAILEQPVETQEVLMPVKIVFSVLNCPGDANSAQEVFRKLNIVLDEAENASQWLLRFDTDIESRYLRRLTIITELKNALQIDQQELSMVYQPKLSLKTMEVNGLEALIRWNSNVLGFVPPDEFIEIAEQAGLIELVTEWVLTRVISDIIALREKGIMLKPAVNLSTQDIQNRPLLDRFIRLLGSNNLSAEDITLEITESDLVADANMANTNLQYLQDLGFGMSIDDFGTGYSSLAYLKNLPVSGIKIDKSFVLNLSSDTDDQQIVHTVLSLAAIFNLNVVAEGVEDLQALETLASWGCDTAQGYYISRPLTFDALIEWLETTTYYKQ